MRHTKKRPDVDESAARFRRNLDAATGRPDDAESQFDRFRDLTTRLLQAPKVELDKRRKSDG